MDINKALNLLAERNGSELFITVGHPPCLKVNKQLVSVSSQPLSSEHVEKALLAVMGKLRFQSFKETMESNYAFDHEEGRFRVSAFYQKGEPGMVIRRIHDHTPTLEELGLPEFLGDHILGERGLILLTGAAGSGKSTSMASLVNHRNAHGKGHIITIEDPIEFIHNHDGCVVTQREVGLDTHSYEEGLANALRQAPDLVVIGEIRTPQVMKHTLEFVETGHMCIATLHANNAHQAFERIIHFFPPEQHHEILLDLSMSVRAIISQQLIPSADGKKVYPVHEILLNTPRMADLIKQGKIDEMSDLIEKSADAGMQTTDQALLELYKAKKISAEEALRYANSSNNIRLAIKMQEPLTDHKKNNSPDSGFLTLSDD